MLNFTYLIPETIRNIPKGGIPASGLFLIMPAVAEELVYLIVVGADVVVLVVVLVEVEFSTSIACHGFLVVLVVVDAVVVDVVVASVGSQFGHDSQ